jgi:hypothetical protein
MKVVGTAGKIASWAVGAGPITKGIMAAIDVGNTVKSIANDEDHIHTPNFVKGTVFQPIFSALDFLHTPKHVRKEHSYESLVHKYGETNRGIKPLPQRRHHEKQIKPREVQWQNYWKSHFSYGDQRRNDIIDRTLDHRLNWNV